jgi:hypothetical protein
MVFKPFLKKKILPFMRENDKVQKYCTAGQATDDNVVHVHYMLDT